MRLSNVSPFPEGIPKQFIDAFFGASPTSKLSQQGMFHPAQKHSETNMSYERQNYNYK